MLVSKQVEGRFERHRIWCAPPGVIVDATWCDADAYSLYRGSKLYIMKKLLSFWMNFPVSTIKSLTGPQTFPITTYKPKNGTIYSEAMDRARHRLLRQPQGDLPLLSSFKGHHWQHNSSMSRPKCPHQATTMS